ncbi:MAG: hypothetical protein WBH47_03565 [Streptosporangiaceae bacterium]
MAAFTAGTICAAVLVPAGGGYELAQAVASRPAETRAETITP